ncbi:hypothetical protein ACQEUU_06830 [Nonomuraea sp. CA-218870]|uniref:hypothetical protein n=1 Tax=Nonomuraea sp. CA-218870 TaxID=3239998 RepID=UPI003D8C6930
MRTIMLAAAAAVVMLVGCGQQPAARTSLSPAAPSTTAPPADGGSYASPRDIVAKLTAAGIACSDYTPVPDPINAKELGGCQGGNLVVGIYEREGDVQAQVEIYRAVGDELDSGPDVVTGRNWTVHTTNREHLDLVWKALGGKVHLE